METGITRLNLLSPLYFIPVEEPDFFKRPEGKETAPDGEDLFCFELDEIQCRSIEPEKTRFPGTLVFYGKTAPAAAGRDRHAGEPFFELPRGSYLFVQKREILSRKAIIDLAVEVQAEGLWQRLVPGRRLYIRRLFEDGQWVTQLLRPYSE